MSANTNSGISAPKGTIVNGHPIECYSELRKRVAELEAMLADGSEQIKKMQEHPVPGVNQTMQPSIPDWIAPGKWVTDGNECRRISCIHDKLICCDRFVKNDKRQKDTISSKTHISSFLPYFKPFTPPPCPELPKDFRWSKKRPSETEDWLVCEGIRMPLAAWIAAAQAHPVLAEDEYYSLVDSLPILTAIRDWREKWGEG